MAHYKDPLEPGEVGWSSVIQVGDKVTFVHYDRDDRYRERTGRAVMPASGGGWVLDMGGAYGQPQVVHDDVIIAVKAPPKRRAAKGRGDHLPPLRLSPAEADALLDVLGRAKARGPALGSAWKLLHEARRQYDLTHYRGPWPALGGRASKTHDVASVILQQLGGAGRLQAMGVSHILSYGPASSPHGEGLGGASFRLAGVPRGRANYVKIVLDPDDTYAVTFGRVGRGSYKVLGLLHGVYADHLRELIEKETGFLLGLGTLGGRGAKKVEHPIGVHSIGFPKTMTARQIKSWLAAHDFAAPLRIDRGKGGGKYAWARLRNVSPMFKYRTDHWDTSVGEVAVRFAIHRRRAAKRDVEREVAALRRKAA